jgi:hypothetical protein
MAELWQAFNSGQEEPWSQTHFQTAHAEQDKASEGAAAERHEVTVGDTTESIVIRHVNGPAVTTSHVPDASAHATQPFHQLLDVPGSRAQRLLHMDEPA